ncbi:MAG TPA: DUF1003 domain-containing protein [Tepidiformaceae bacterium]|nr:DUF1003 domain-containing protein [Tepidiformaceae bacterium]
MSRFKVPLHPYHSPEQIKHMVDEMAPAAGPLVHPQQVIHALRSNRPAIARVNGWLADHIVGLAGTMAFFYFLAVLIGGWALWQSLFEHDTGFDAYPYSFLFFILGGIMQSLFVPTMLTASNRAAERDRIKDETDHRAWSHLYDVNDEQVRILRLLATRYLESQETAATPPAS